MRKEIGILKNLKVLMYVHETVQRFLKDKKIILSKSQNQERKSIMYVS